MYSINENTLQQVITDKGLVYYDIRFGRSRQLTSSVLVHGCTSDYFLHRLTVDHVKGNTPKNAIKMPVEVIIEYFKREYGIELKARYSNSDYKLYTKTGLLLLSEVERTGVSFGWILDKLYTRLIDENSTAKITKLIEDNQDIFKVVPSIKSVKKTDRIPILNNGLLEYGELNLLYIYDILQRLTVSASLFGADAIKLLTLYIKDVANEGHVGVNVYNKQFVKYKGKVYLTDGISAFTLNKDRIVKEVSKPIKDYIRTKLNIASI